MAYVGGGPWGKTGSEWGSEGANVAWVEGSTGPLGSPASPAELDGLAGQA